MHSVRVKRYQAVGIAEEVQTLCERATVLHYTYIDFCWRLLSCLLNRVEAVEGLAQDGVQRRDLVNTAVAAALGSTGDREVPNKQSNY